MEHIRSSGRPYWTEGIERVISAFTAGGLNLPFVFRARCLANILLLVSVSLFSMPHSHAAELGFDSGQPASAPPASLDFKLFQRRIEPIFLKHRAGHARCYMCHSSPGSELTNAPAFLDDLPTGKRFWRPEQSRINFQRVLKFVVPGNPEMSPLLIYPLAPEMGGGGTALVPRCGRQFASKNDSDWQTIAAWIRKLRMPDTK